MGRANMSDHTNTKTTDQGQIPDYGYHDATNAHTHAYLFDPVLRALNKANARTVFDLGCGNGSFASLLADHFDVTGIDYSKTGIQAAKVNFPNVKLEEGSAYDDLSARYGQFDAVISLEVVEHLFDPRLYAKRVFELVKPGGVAIISTPYHGYLKNLALAITGKMDKHFTALWDGGHIKFFSFDTLGTLLAEAGFKDVGFTRVGRVPVIAKSMIAIAFKPINVS
jgi:2-polyprenyl-3-methyl-5-hydroxy-6-metoxy-1,4-benzoquinol methylase